MTDAQAQTLIQQAVHTYPTMLQALLSAMRTYPRDDEPRGRATAPAAIPLSIACVLTVRLAQEPGALELAGVLLAGALAMMGGRVPPEAASVGLSADVLRRLEDEGVI